MRKLLIILGVPVDDLTMESALERLEQFIAVGRATGKTHQVATVNADFVVNALHDPELRYILQTADMATADGMPVVLGARLLGVPLTGRVTGADLVPALAARAAAQGYSIFLLGAAPGIAAQAATILQEQHPRLQIAGVLSPPNRPITEMDPAVLDAIQQARPDILLVAFGNPKQEKWIHMHAHQLRVPVCIGVGGTFDMIAGVTRRAPLWMQQAGLEWIYRLMQEPGRLWKRYVRDMLHFGPRFVRQWWAMRRAPLTTLGSEGITPEPAPEVRTQATVINIHGRLDITNCATLTDAAEQALDVHPVVVVNLADATFLDSSALGALVALANRARAAGGALRLAAVPPNILSILALVQLDRFFELYDDVQHARDHQHASTVAVPASPTAPDDWAVVKMPRTVDSGTVSGLVERCAARLIDNPRLVLDFSDTVFLSSAGLSGMANLHHLSRKQGGELRIASCSRDVLHGIKLVQLDRVIPLYQDVSTAVEGVPTAG